MHTASSPLHNAVARVLKCSRWQKRAIMLMADAVALPVMLWTAYALRFGNLFPPIEDVWLFPLTVLVGLPALYLLGFYRSIVRYLGAEVAWSVVLGMTATVVVLASLSYMVPAMVPRSVFLIFWILGVLYLGSSRFLARRFLYRIMSGYFTTEPVAVYGAGCICLTGRAANIGLAGLSPCGAQQGAFGERAGS